eukprot:1633606-Rhodomonas_salina.2
MPAQRRAIVRHGEGSRTLDLRVELGEHRCECIHNLLGILESLDVSLENLERISNDSHHSCPSHVRHGLRNNDPPSLLCQPSSALHFSVLFCSVLPSPRLVSPDPRCPARS